MARPVTWVDPSSAVCQAQKSEKPHPSVELTIKRQDDGSVGTSGAVSPQPASRPKLPVPDYALIKTPDYTLIKTLDAQYAVESSLADLQMAEDQLKLKKLEDLFLQKANKVRENAELAKSSHTWSFLKKIASYVASSIATVFGLSLITAAGLTTVAGAMVASGVLAIANLILIETGVWDRVAEKLAAGNEEKKKKLKFLLPTAAGALSAVVGLVGSGGALLWGPLNFSQATVAIGMTAVNFAQGVTTIGSAVSQARTLWGEAALVEIETNMQLNQTYLQQAQACFERLMQSLSRAAQMVSAIIKMSIQNYQDMLI